MNREASGPANLAELVRGLAQLGIVGFGGVGPQAYHFFVERSGWLSADEFAERYGLAQALPGANVVNLCAILGDRWFGPAGALAAVSAITVPPLVIVLIAATAITHVPRTPRLGAAESAVVAASAGLIFATAYRMLATIRQRRVMAALLAATVACALAVHTVGMPVATLAGVAAGCGIDLLARRGR